jgi:hypothetical protein
MPRKTPLIALILLSACSPKPPQQTQEALLLAGKPKGEKVLPAARSDELLRAAQRLHRAGDFKGMQEILAQLDPRRMSSAERIAFALLKANLALEQGDPEAALAHLAALEPTQIPEYLRKDYHELRARAFSVQGNLLKSLRERIALTPWLTAPKEVETNQQAILQALELVPLEALSELKAKPGSDLAGWIALAKLLRDHPYRSETLDAALLKWRAAYPYHPADRGRFLERLLARREFKAHYRVPQTLALLLPRSGPFQAAAEVIRHAIEAARSFPGETYHPQLIEYDSSATDPVLQYQQAKAQGAEFILGPLEKPELERLARLESFNPPVLALNNAALTRPGLYQFALPPEEGVAQVADSAFSHGHRRALLLVPATPAGERILRFFLAYWEKLGGKVLEIQRYPPTGDVSSALRRLLNVDESERRFERVRHWVSAAQFIPRPRRDAEVLFLQATPEQGRVIKPQLGVYRAHLPVYATWDIYAGRPEPSLDQDLEGIRFCDLPWLLQGEYEPAPSPAEFEAKWGRLPGAYLRLAALGIDAYRIPAKLLGIGGRYAGASGILSLDAKGLILRQLTCAEFRHGVPVIYGLAPQSSHVANLRPKS